MSGIRSGRKKLPSARGAKPLSIGPSARATPERRIRETGPLPFRRMLFLLRAFSFVLAVLPESVCRLLSVAVGELVFWGIARRRHSVLSNLSHAFPDRPHAWLVRAGRRSFHRMIETGLLALVYPQLPLSRVRRMAVAHPELSATLDRLVADRRPVVLAISHMGAWDLSSAIPAIYDGALPEVAGVYRPLRNRKLDAWVRAARERFGVRMLSRKAGFNEGMQILRRGGIFGILFDQNARDSGTLSLLFDRVCSTTHLPGLLTEKFDATPAIFVSRRLAFWRYELQILVPDDIPRTADALTNYLNHRQENLLRGDEELSITWLWVHNRWKTQVEPARRFRLEHKRSILPPPEAMPRRTRFFIRLPETSEQVATALPFLQRLRVSRPDAALTALAPAAVADLTRSCAFFDAVETLPERPHSRRRFARTLRHRYPDCWIDLTADPRAAAEARLSACPQRFGLVRSGAPLRGLTHACTLPPDADLARPEVWTDALATFFTHFGLPSAPDETA
jgi:lauroyl/myristoyl acyltransferase